MHIKNTEYSGLVLQELVHQQVWSTKAAAEHNLWRPPISLIVLCS